MKEKKNLNDHYEKKSNLKNQYVCHISNVNNTSMFNTCVNFLKHKLK